jgi:hypothetical protein
VTKRQPGVLRLKREVVIVNKTGIAVETGSMKQMCPSLVPVSASDQNRIDQAKRVGVDGGPFV